MVYLELLDVLAIAADVLGLEADAVLRVVDLGLLDSAIARPQSGFGGQEVFSTLPLKGAALLAGIVKNHALLDGNKRTGTIAADLFFRKNGFELDLMPASEARDVIVAVAASEMNLEKLAEWLESRLTEVPTDE